MTIRMILKMRSITRYAPLRVTANTDAAPSTDHQNVGSPPNSPCSAR
jgi:hypothetical protein